MDTSLRDGLQGTKVDPGVAADVMVTNVQSYLKHARDGGVVHFDAVSSAKPERVPVMGVYPKWLSALEASEIDSVQLQALVFNNDPKAIEMLKGFVRLGRIKSFAFVHSHDPDFLWANSNIRKHTTGDEISREDAPRYAADIIWQSRQRYEKLRRVAQELGIPLNVYMSRATGSREDAQTVETADVEAVMNEMKMIDLLPGSRFIVCDTDAVNDHGFLAEILTEVRGQLLETHSDVGVHLHVMKNDPGGVQRLVRSAVRALSGRRIYMETGMAGLGGCIALKDASANLDVFDLVTAMREIGVRMLPFEPDTAHLGRAKGVLESIKSGLR